MDASDAPKRTVRVTIFNQSYNVSTAGDEAETQELAQRVDDLMSSIARRAGNLDTTRTAVLACLHMADRLRAVERQLAGMTDKTRDLTELLDQVVLED